MSMTLINALFSGLKVKRELHTLISFTEAMHHLIQKNVLCKNQFNKLKPSPLTFFFTTLKYIHKEYTYIYMYA